MSKSNVVQLLARRDEARDRAHASPDQARIETLRDAIAIGTNRGKDVSALVEERDVLKAKAHAEFMALGVEITGARRALRASEAEARAAELESLSTAELETKRAELSAQRRAMKAEMRGVVAALSKRHVTDTVKTLWDKCTPAEREELKKLLDA